ncbi:MULTISPECIES: acyl-CoA dehydrogenase family protein [Olivibacter]|uniref:Acyl-CoA dehydrogenase n=1 Tax=Olivibacter jilunii TaxID=985016 RepID=A0ABW6ATW7_9SPHI
MKLLQELKKIAAELRQESLEAELQGSLTTKQLAVIYENKLFNLFVPKAYGGLDLSLTEALQIERLLAEIDGSLGWTVTLCSGANMFVGFLNQDIAHPLFSNKKVCFGGSGRVGGHAEIMEEGYLVSGKWQYATGAAHNTVFTANCEIYQNGEPLLDAAKKPVIKSFFFLQDEVTILHDWNAMGLKATASHSFEVNNLKVEKRRAFKIDPQGAILKAPIYRYPFQQFAEATLCVNTLGMTCRFLDLCHEIFDEKYSDVRDNYHGKMKLPDQYLSNAKLEMNNLQRQLYELVEKSWMQLNTTNAIDLALLEQISKHTRLLVKTAQQWVAKLYPYCGMKAASPTEEINRMWRDLFTASQHSLFTSPIIDEID